MAQSPTSPRTGSSAPRPHLASVTGGASATLTLAFTGDISALAVRVLAAAHSGSTAVTSAAQALVNPQPKQRGACVT